MHNYASHRISRMEEYFEHYIDNVSGLGYEMYWESSQTVILKTPLFKSY